VVAVATANSFTSFEVSRAFARLLDFDGFTGVKGGITALGGVGRFDRNVSFGHIKEGPSSAITGVANRASWPNVELRGVSSGMTTRGFAYA
jgi:hypothetical protein